MRAIITGASSGIGKAIALKLAKQGWELAVISRSKEKLHQLQTELEVQGNQAHVFFVGDLSQLTTVDAFCTAISDRWKHLDLIVNNAGEYVPGDVGSLRLEQLEEQLTINFRSGFQLIQHFVPMLKQQGKGRIVFMSSHVVRDPRPFAAAYTLSKSLNDMYARLLSEELRENGIGVTRIVPGSVNTATWGDADVPRTQFVQPEEIAQLVSDICQMPDSTWVEELQIRPIDKNW